MRSSRAFVLLKQGQTPSAELRQALVATLQSRTGSSRGRRRAELRDHAAEDAERKIMRRVLKAVILDREPGDITTIEEEGSVEEARQAWRRMKADTLER